MLWTTEGRPHLSRIRGCVCWCLICNVLQLDDLDDAVACPAKLFTVAEVKEKFLYADVHVLVAEWSTERIPPPPMPRDEQVLPPPVVEREVELPFVCEQIYRTGLWALRHSDQDCAGCAPNPQQETPPRSRTLCRLRLVCGNQCCKSGAILARPACLRIHLKDSVRRCFCRASCARKAQRNELWNFLRCLVLSAERSGQKVIRHLLTWLAHLRAFLPHGDLVR